MSRKVNSEGTHPVVNAVPADATVPLPPFDPGKQTGGTTDWGSVLNPGLEARRGRYAVTPGPGVVSNDRGEHVTPPGTDGPRNDGLGTNPAMASNSKPTVTPSKNADKKK